MLRRQSSPLRRNPIEPYPVCSVSSNSSVVQTKMVDKAELIGGRHFHILWHTFLVATALFAVTAAFFWFPVVPTDWLIRLDQQKDLISLNPVTVATTVDELPGSYSSVDEMLSRIHRFPSIDERVQVYMSNWYAPPCHHNVRDAGFASSIASNFVQYNFLHDDKGDPLLVLREIMIPQENLAPIVLTDDSITSNDEVNGILVDRFSPSGNHRTFLLDSEALERGARVFYLSADAVRRCTTLPCVDTVNFLFPSLHRVDMATSSFRASDASTGYPGNALDPIDGNRGTVVPVLLQFGDLDVFRSFCAASLRNESYPATPLFRKFRGSLTTSERDRVTTSRSCYSSLERAVPTSHRERHLQPIVTKLTYKRHFGMLDEIPAADVPWAEKLDAAIWRGALTGMKRNGYRVRKSVQASGNNTNLKRDICLNMQRCKMVYQHAQSTLINASLVGVTTEQSHTLDSQVVPNVLDGIRLYGPRVSYHDILRYKAIIMLEGNDISSGLKWALYSNSVVMAQKPTFTSWAMEELLEPWIHYIPIADDLSDVEDKARWVMEHDTEARAIARAGSLWISDLVYHPDVPADESAIFDETFRRYKEHFIYNPALNVKDLLNTQQ